MTQQKTTTLIIRHLQMGKTAKTISKCYVHSEARNQVDIQRMIDHAKLLVKANKGHLKFYRMGIVFPNHTVWFTNDTLHNPTECSDIHFGSFDHINKKMRITKFLPLV